MRPDLDAWLPDHTLRVAHERAAPAPAADLWDAAGSVRVGDTRRLGRVVRWRIPGTPADRTYRELLRSYPFTVLEEGEAHSVAGLAGRIWTLRRDYPHLAGAEEFRRHDAPGTVRVVFAHWVEPDGEDGAVLHSDVRVAPVDGEAARHVRALRPLVAAFGWLIGPEPLALAVRRATSARRGAP